MDHPAKKYLPEKVRRSEETHIMVSDETGLNPSRTDSTVTLHTFPNLSVL